MLLDAFGNPVKIQPLTKELAGPLSYVRQSIFETVASGLTPSRLASILQAAKEGDAVDFLTLAIDMEEREPHYASVIGTRKQAVSGLALQVESASDAAEDVKQADAIRDILRTDAFSELVDDLMDAVAKGFSVCEIMWDKSETLWWPAEFHWRDPRWFVFHRNTDQIYLKNGIAAIDPPGEPLAPFKFIVHYPKIRNGLKIASGIARLVAVSFMCKSYVLKDWMTFIETYGHPLRLGRYSPVASQGDIDILRRAVLGLGIDAAAVLPDSMKIDFEQPPNTTGGDKLFEGMGDWLDRQVSKAVLGQTMTTDNGSSLAQAKVHEEVRQDILVADTKKLCASLNRYLVKPFIDLNYGRRDRGKYPRIYFPFKDQIDITAFAGALAQLVPLGLRVEQSVVCDRLGIPDAGKDAVILQSAQPQPQPPPKGPVKTALNAQTAAIADDLADEIVAAALDDWEEIMPELVDPIRKAAEESNSYEEFAEKLLALADTIDPKKLTRALAEATWKARTAGNAE